MKVPEFNKTIVCASYRRKKKKKAKKKKKKNAVNSADN